MLDHCNIRASTGSRSSGASGSAKFEYITRTGAYDLDGDEVVGIVSGNMPEWAGPHGQVFWEAGDRFERANALIYRQFVFSLPNECTEVQAIELAERFTRMVVGDDHPFTLAVHSGKGENLHAHLVWSDRVFDGIDRTPETFFKRANTQDPSKGGATKTRDRRDVEWLIGVREGYADLMTVWQSEHGLDGVVDERSYEAQGLDKIPMVHEGHGPGAEERAEYNQAVRERNAELERLKQLSREVEQLEAEVSELARQPVLPVPTPEAARPAAVPAVVPPPDDLVFTGWMRGAWKVGKLIVAALVDAAKNVLHIAFDPAWHRGLDLGGEGRIYRAKGPAVRLGTLAVLKAVSLEVVDRRAPPVAVYDFHPPRPLGLPAPEIPQPSTPDRGQKRDEGMGR